VRNRPCCCSRLKASCSANVRPRSTRSAVPPSAWRTSRDRDLDSPSATRSQTARNDGRSGAGSPGPPRIACLWPPRVTPAPLSSRAGMEYSAVSPSPPLPRIHGGHAVLDRGRARAPRGRPIVGAREPTRGAGTIAPKVDRAQIVEAGAVKRDPGRVLCHPSLLPLDSFVGGPSWAGSEGSLQTSSAASLMVS